MVALAACDNKGGGDPEHIIEPPETHGTAGDLKWEFDLRTDHLLIKGAGEMSDFENPNTREYIKPDQNTAPWRPWQHPRLPPWRAVG